MFVSHNLVSHIHIPTPNGQILHIFSQSNSTTHFDHSCFEVLYFGSHRQIRFEEVELRGTQNIIDTGDDFLT